MLSRSTLLAGLFTATLSVGGAVLYFHNDLTPTGGLRWSALKEIVTTHGGSEAQTQRDNWDALVPSWRDKLTVNKELVLYGALAFLALSMIALVIGATSNKSKDPKRSEER